MTLKKEQDHLERALAREYAEMQAQGQADEGASKVEPEELAKWQDRALARWDLMLRRQQTRLQEVRWGGSGGGGGGAATVLYGQPMRTRTRT